MGQFVRICGIADLPAEGTVAEIRAGNLTLCLANVGGTISALNNVCPHRQGPLGQGTVEEGHVICPLHAWAFHAATGAYAHKPQESVQVYSVKILGQDVLADIG
ncbi:MAG TPA: Rieske 2Fe-2S domain-containing protein [Acidisarcina sp.]|nr:Rieske 2Fe-2S domain-containing protein [Acidisarcina sp.]